MLLDHAIVAKRRVVKRETVVLIQQVRQQSLPDFNGRRRDGAARVGESDNIFMV
jgi:hypothetical protein